MDVSIGSFEGELDTFEQTSRRSDAERPDVIKDRFQRARITE
jgi:hypothetical protein